MSRAARPFLDKDIDFSRQNWSEWSRKKWRSMVHHNPYFRSGGSYTVIGYYLDEYGLYDIYKRIHDNITSNYSKFRVGTCFDFFNGKHPKWGLNDGKWVKSPCDHFLTMMEAEKAMELAGELPERINDYEEHLRLASIPLGVLIDFNSIHMV